MLSILLTALIAHPFHVSIAEAEWNGKSQRFEFSIRFDPRDFTAALSKDAKQRIDLEKTEAKELRSVIMRYMRSRFSVSDQRDNAARWHWIGLENETKFVWVYLELEPPSSATRLNLKNDLLFEVAPTQVNTIVLSDGKDKQTLRFFKKQPTHVLRRDGDAWVSVAL